jgi:hypothetical protein
LIALVEPSVERSGTSTSCQYLLQVTQYRVIQHGRSVWEVTKSVIAKKGLIWTCVLILIGYRDSAVET